MKLKTAINPTRKENFSLWYQNIIKEADLAENSDVKGCMIIKPWGYSIWEKITFFLDKLLKNLDYNNAYFPLLIPKSFLEKESKHIQGFSKECAIVTHTKLVLDKDGFLVPSSKLKEPLIIRPTSETIIGVSFSKWISSYRDLPIKINQWANVVRWEMRTRLFLRTTEFLWQEGHSAFSTEKEAHIETYSIINKYKNFLENYMCIPSYIGEKTILEKFPGAQITMCLEAMMQDKKSLQLCTSHFLAQNFSKAFNIKFNNKIGKQDYAWTMSFGITTRIIGALIMLHADDNGIILPPKISPYQVIILPRINNEIEENKKKILEYSINLKNQLEKLIFFEEKINVFIDKKDEANGQKLWNWIKKGIPIIIEIGEKEIQSNIITFYKRNILNPNTKFFLNKEELIKNLNNILEKMNSEIYISAFNNMIKNTTYIKTKEEFYNLLDNNLENKNFIICHWKENSEIEQYIKNKYSISVRCILNNHNCIFSNIPIIDKCIFSGEKTDKTAIFAKSY